MTEAEKWHREEARCALSNCVPNPTVRINFLLDRLGESLAAAASIEQRAERAEAENQRLRAALRHQVLRNHNFSHGCDGCAEALLVEEGHER